MPVAGGNLRGTSVGLTGGRVTSIALQLVNGKTDPLWSVTMIRYK